MIHVNFTLFVVKCVFRANHDAIEIRMAVASKCAIIIWDHLLASLCFQHRL